MGEWESGRKGESYFRPLPLPFPPSPFPLFPNMPKSYLFLLLLLTGVGVAQAQESLSLAQALDLALARNYTVRMARNDGQVAENNYTLGNAGFLPSLSLSAGYSGTLANTKQQFLGQDAATDRTGAQTTRQSAGAVLNWTVFDGLGRRATYRRLDVLREQQALSTERTVEAVAADVVIAYYAIVQQQEQYRVLEEAVQISEERVRIAEARLDLGSASELEVRQARVDRNADRALLLRQEVALDNARAAFNQLLARPVDQDFVAADTLLLDTVLSLEALRETALGFNRTLLLAEQDRSVALLSLREIQAERFPSINFNLGYQFSKLEAESGFLVSNRSFDFNYGLALSYSLFDGFNRRRRAENTRLRINNTEINLEELRAQLETQLSTGFKIYRNDLELIALEEENLVYTRQNVDIALERFRLGTITSVELREVQETLTRAQSRLIAARFDAKRTETELLELTGAWRPVGR